MKFFAVVIGMLLSVLLFAGVMWLHNLDRPEFHGQQDQEGGLIAGVLFFIPFVLPLFYVTGSVATGFLIQSSIDDCGFFDLLYYAPGLYFWLILVVLYFLPWSCIAILSDPIIGWSCFLFPLYFIAILLIWTFSSGAGVWLGYKLRRRLSERLQP